MAESIDDMMKNRAAEKAAAKQLKDGQFQHGAKEAPLTADRIKGEIIEAMKADFPGGPQSNTVLQTNAVSAVRDFVFRNQGGLSVTFQVNVDFIGLVPEVAGRIEVGTYHREFSIKLDTDENGVKFVDQAALLALVRGYAKTLINQT